MEHDGFDQIEYFEEMGHCPNMREDMLHQVRAESCASADTRRDC